MKSSHDVNFNHEGIDQTVRRVDKAQSQNTHK